MKKIFLLTFTFLLVSTGFAQTNGDYRSVGSGLWSSMSTWSKYSSANLAWGPATSAPGSVTTLVTIAAGNTVTLGASASVNNVTIEATGILNSSTTSNGSPWSLSLGTAANPNVVVTNNGTFGDISLAADGIILQAAVNCASLTVTGTGTSSISRFRPVVGNSNALVLTFDQSINFGYNGVCFTAYYGSAADATTENCTLNINAGKTIKLTAAGGSVHSGSKITYPQGVVTYNINGTLDMSATTAVLNFVPDSATSTASATMNIFGLVKLSAAGLNTVTNLANNATMGKSLIIIKTGGVLDATANTGVSSMNTSAYGVSGVGYGSFLQLEGTGILKRMVGIDAKLFPLGLSQTSYSPVTLTNTGAADSFSVSLKNTFDNAPTDANVVNKQWKITQLGTQSANIATSFGWVVADQSTNFNPTANNVNIMNYTNGSWKDYGITTSPPSGSGTLASPYIASQNNFTSFGNFGISNGTTVLPLQLISFTAAMKSDAVLLNWLTTNEVDMRSFEVERADMANTFTSLVAIPAKNISGINCYSFVDNNAGSGNIYYRLKMTNIDGSFGYSEISVVNQHKMGLLSAFPNPAINKIMVTYPAASANASLQIISLEGKVAATYLVDINATNSSINVSTLASGTYWLKFNNKEIVYNTKFIKL